MNTHTHAHAHTHTLSVYPNTLSPQIGNHHALLRKGGLYYELVRRQTASSE